MNPERLRTYAALSRFYSLSLADIRAMRLPEFNAYVEFMTGTIEAENAASNGTGPTAASPSTVHLKGTPRAQLGRARPE